MRNSAQLRLTHDVYLRVTFKAKLLPNCNNIFYQTNVLSPLVIDIGTSKTDK